MVKDLTPPPDAAAPSKDVDVVAYGVKDVAAYAMKVVKSTSERDEETFSRYALWRGPEACLEEIMKFESELKAGELKNVQNLPALLTERLREITII